MNPNPFRHKLPSTLMLCLLISSACTKDRAYVGGDRRPPFWRDGAEEHAIFIRAQDNPTFTQHWDDIYAKVLNQKSCTPGATTKREKLYRIVKYDKGSPQRSYGKLKPSQLVDNVGSVPSNFSGYTVQIGLGITDDYSLLPGGSAQQMPTANYRQNMIESKQMVTEVNRVLAGKDPERCNQ